MNPNDPYQKNLRKRMKRMLIIVGSLLVAIILIDLVKNLVVSKMIAKFIPSTVTISTSVSQSETWTPTMSAVGSLVAVNGVEVSPELSGLVTDIKFNSGEMVTAGQPLIQLEDRADQQDLNNLQSQLQLAQIKYNQQVALFQSKATSQVSLMNPERSLKKHRLRCKKPKY